MCPLGNIYWRFRLPGEVGVVLPVGIVGVAILGINRWPILAHCFVLISVPNSIPKRRNYGYLAL